MDAGYKLRLQTAKRIAKKQGYMSMITLYMKLACGISEASQMIDDMVADGTLRQVYGPSRKYEYNA